MTPETTPVKAEQAARDVVENTALDWSKIGTGLTPNEGHFKIDLSGVCETESEVSVIANMIGGNTAGKVTPGGSLDVWVAVA